MILFGLFLLLLIIFAYKNILKPLGHWERKGVQHDRPFLFFGSLGSNILGNKPLADIVLDTYRKYKNERYYGFYQFLTPVLVVKDLELIRRIGIKDFEYFADHRTIIPENVDPVLGKSLFALSGPKWKNLRITLSPGFTASKMKFMFGLISDCAKDFTKFFLEKDEDVVEVELKDIFIRFANDAFATSTFGMECNSLKDPDNIFYRMGYRLRHITSGFRRFIFFIYGLSHRLVKYFNIRVFDKDISDFFTNIIDQSLKMRRETGFVRPDMIHLLMQAQKGQLTKDNENIKESNFAAVKEFLGEENGQKIRITDEDIVAQAMIYFLGGYDNVALLLSCIAYELAVNPDIQERLLEEVEDAFSKSEGNPSYQDVMSMQYLDMVVSESIRKYPPTLFFDRTVTKRYVIEPTREGEKPLVLEEGDTLSLPVYGIQHDPKYYPDPEKFDPERFNEENRKNINSYNFIPFGIGPRNCIGSRLALMECKILIVHLLYHFEIITTGKTPNPFVLDPKHITLTPVGGFWVGLSSRKRKID